MALIFTHLGHRGSRTHRVSPLLSWPSDSTNTHTHTHTHSHCTWTQWRRQCHDTYLAQEVRFIVFVGHAVGVWLFLVEEKKTERCEWWQMCSQFVNKKRKKNNIIRLTWLMSFNVIDRKNTARNKSLTQVLDFYSCCKNVSNLSQWYKEIIILFNLLKCQMSVVYLSVCN